MVTLNDTDCWPGATACYAECLVPQLPVLPAGVAELKEKYFSSNLSLTARSTEDLGEILIQGKTYTWVDADGTVIIEDDI